MVVSDTVDLGSIFHRKKKKAAPPPVAPNTNFNFPAPMAPMTADQIALLMQPGAIVAAGGQPGGPTAQIKASVVPGGPVASPMGPTVAPTFVDQYLPWMIGGGVILVGAVTLLLLKKSGKI